MDPRRKQQYTLYGTLFLVMVGMGVIIPILPHFARELGANSVQMGLLISVWAGAQFIFAPMWGALSDRIGRRPVLMIGLGGFSVTFLIASVAGDIWTLMLARFLGGLLSAATLPTAQAYVADTSDGAERTARLTAMGAAMNMGFICGPALGGLLAGLGFRGTFALVGLLGLLNLGAMALVLPEPARLTARGERKGFSGFKAISMAMAGPEALLFILAFVATFGTSAMFAMLGYFMADRMGAGPEMLAVAFTVEGGAAVLFQTLAVSPAVRRYGSERVVGGALLSGAVGFLLLIIAANIPVVLGGVVFIAVALAIMRPVISGMVSERTRLEQGITMGIQNSFDALGRTLGPLLAGTLYLWRDWAPFASSLFIYALFFIITLRAWGTGAARFQEAESSQFGQGQR